MKMEKKSRVNLMKLATRAKTYTNRDVEREHQRMVERLSMLKEDRDPDPGVLAALDLYFRNYRDWKLAKSNQLTDALEADSRHLSDIDYEKKMRKDQEIRAAHKKNMSATLEQARVLFLHPIPRGCILEHGRPGSRDRWRSDVHAFLRRGDRLAHFVLFKVT